MRGLRSLVTLQTSTLTVRQQMPQDNGLPSGVLCSVSSKQYCKDVLKGPGSHQLLPYDMATM